MAPQAIGIAQNGLGDPLARGRGQENRPRDFRIAPEIGLRNDGAQAISWRKEPREARRLEAGIGASRGEVAWQAQSCAKEQLSL